MAALSSVDSIELPQELIVNSSGLALDIGGSAAKIAYRSNKEYKNGKPITDKVKGKYGCLHLAMYPLGDTDDIIKFLSENCDLTKDKNGVISVNAAGMGSYGAKAKIEDALGIKITIVPEMDGFVKAFKTLIEVVPEDKLLHPQTERAAREIKKYEDILAGIASKIKGTTEMKTYVDFEGGEPEPEAAPSPEVKPGMIKAPLPALLGMVGSATVFFLLKEDGSFKMADGLHFAGRSFMGIANQLVGINDYDRLMEMADSADGRTADILGLDLKAGLPADSFYSVIQDDQPVYLFGKGATAERSEMKDEDIVNSLLHQVCFVHANTAHNNATIHGVKNVFFCGNFVRGSASRSFIELYGVTKNMMYPDSACPTFKFLQAGAYYGVIGSYIQNKEADAEEGSK